MGSAEGEPGSEGHEAPLHEVTLTEPIQIAAHDVTVGQFKQFVRESDYRTEAENGGGAWCISNGAWKSDPKINWRNPGFEQSDEHPVVCVSWNDANAFCEWLSKKENKSYSLPTEAQWEYACRGGSQTKFYFGDDHSKLGEYAWYVRNSNMMTHPVGLKKCNNWGLYDMSGHVWQWTADRYAADFYQNSPRDNPTGPTKARPVCCAEAPGMTFRVRAALHSAVVSADLRTAARTWAFASP